MSQGFTLLLAATLVCGVAWAVREDLLFHRISNRLTGSMLCVGLSMHTLAGAWTGLAQAILGILVGLGCLLPFYIARATGAGDVKLLAAAGALLGPQDAWMAGLSTLLIGAVLAILYLVGGAVRAIARAPAGCSWKMRAAHAHLRVQELRRERMPYALAVALGSLTAGSQSGELTQALSSIWRVT
jgi:prepilin peptidase CpaA